MFCPNCGASQSDDLRFCKQCGVNLAAVRMAVSKPEAVEDFDWSKTWLAEMFMSSEEAAKRQAELERIQGITPEIKRRNEIKAGVITASVGVGLTLVIAMIMDGIIAGGAASAAAIAILQRLWIVGLIPVFVGAALIFNGLVISRRRLPGPKPSDAETSILSPPEVSEFLPPADTNELFPAGFSVTDETTRHLTRK